MAWLMDGADVCRTSSRASRRPLDVISTVAILDPRWRGRKWRHPGPGASFSTPIVAVAQDGGPSASGRHLGWPHLREPEMRSSKMATGSGRAAILRHRHNGGRKTRPILLACNTEQAEHITHWIKKNVQNSEVPFSPKSSQNTPIARPLMRVFCVLKLWFTCA